MKPLTIVLAVPGLPFNGETFDKQSLGGCVTGDTLVDVPRDLKKYPGGIPIAEICDRMAAGEHLHVWSYDHVLRRICLRPITRAWRTKKNAEVWELTYRWVSREGDERAASLRATPDHRIMLRDGTYKALSDLRPGDSLMPFNRYVIPGKTGRYARIDLNDGRFEFEHRLVIKELGIPYHPQRGGKGDVIHHKNFRPFDNSLSNLQVMAWNDHLALHQGGNPAFREWYDNLSPIEYQSFCAKQRALARAYWGELSYEQRKTVNAAPLQNLKAWNANPENMAAKAIKISVSNRRSWNADPRLRALLIANGKKVGGRNRGIPHKPESVQKIRAAWNDQNIKARHSASMKAAWARQTKEQRLARLEKMWEGQRLNQANHTVISVRRLDAMEDVYDLEVPGTHNFAANGIMIHNSESAGHYMAQALGRMGHSVMVFCNTEKLVSAGTADYLPLGMFRGYVEYTPHDVCIVQRAPELFLGYCQARFSVLWCHDLALRRNDALYRGVGWGVDKVAVLSEFMRGQFKEVLGFTDSQLFLTRNGVDLATVEAARKNLEEASDVKPLVRNPLALFYSGRPERGLDVLLTDIMPRILKEEPNAKLYVSSYDNPVEHLADFYRQCDAFAAGLGKAVVKLGSLTKLQLYSAYLSGGLYAYPTPSRFAPEFDEISCVTGDTLIDMPRDYLKHPLGVPIAELVGKSGFPVYCYDHDRQRITLGTVKWVAKTRRNAQVWKLKLDDGSEIRATPEHKVMRRDGTWAELRELHPGDSLMPLYKHIRISVNLNNGWENEHRLVGEWIAGRDLNGHEEHVHHACGYWDTRPDSLRVLSRSEHFSITHKGKKRGTIERKRQKESLKGFFTRLSDQEREEYFSSRPKAVAAMWAKQRSLNPKEYERWLRWRSDKRDLSFMHSPEWREVCRKAGSSSRKKMWERINALPPEQRQAWLDERTDRMREARWNHTVLSVERDVCEDVYDMEVEKHHNFVAGGIVVHNCISLMEAQACGLPVVTSARGALPETLSPEAGRLIAEPVHTEAYAEAFAQACLAYMRDPEARRRASEAGLKRAATLDWDGVAKQWTELFDAEIRARSSNLATLANHFWRRSDIYAARKCLERLPADDPEATAVRRRIAEDWAFIEEPDGFRKQYERIGATHDERVLETAPREPRYQAVKEWLGRRCAELSEGASLNVLDYGCAHGAYATNLLKELPKLRVTGVDIDLRGIQMADRFAEKLGVSDRWRGVVGDLDRLTDPDVPEMREQYDVVLAQEVLEHVPDPGALSKALDARTKDGGRVWWTVPFGPWEYSDYRRYPYRAHVWEFDLNDLHEIFDAKGPTSKLSISAMPFGHSPETDEPLGWWCVQYVVTPEGRGKVGELDWERKLSRQRPRETVSAAIIAGPGCEETLHWCLKSLVHVADELVVADCGLSAEAHRILDQYRWGALDGKEHKPYLLDVKVIPGGDPKTEGFETPRNRALEQCTQRWVLWIDTDEKLLQPDKVHKYLRPNYMNGYSIRQHHFSVDANFGFDMPCRLFRNPRHTGSGMRFFGMIHEHPEMALNEGPGHVSVLPDVHIPHIGYLIESGRRVKFARNLPMLEADEKKYPERLLQKHMLMRDKILIVGYVLGQNGNRRTPEVEKLCREVVDLYQRYFLGKGHFTSEDPIKYYSQANAILGHGFDAAISISTDKVDAQLNGTVKARFASRDDFLKEIAQRAGDAAAPFETRYW